MSSETIATSEAKLSIPSEPAKEDAPPPPTAVTIESNGNPGAGDEGPPSASQLSQRASLAAGPGSQSQSAGLGLGLGIGQSSGEKDETGVDGEEEEPKASSRKTSKASGAAGIGAGNRKASTKKEGGSRRVSMFGDPGKAHKLHDGGEDLKSTLNDLFAYQNRDQTETSSVGKPLRRPKLIYENTYKLYSSKPFSPSRVQNTIQNILDDMLMDFKYNSKTSATKAMEVAEKMRKAVLLYRFERYKICVLVTISPFNRQGFFNGFRCLWDANRDSYAVATMRNPSVFAIAVCYGIYFE